VATWSASSVLGELSLGSATLGGVVAPGQAITVSVDALVVTASLPTATTMLGASVPAAAVSTAASLPAPTIGIGTHVQAEVLAANATAPAPSAQGGASVPVPALSTTAAVPAVTLACAATVAATPAHTTTLVPKANGVGIVPGGVVPAPQPGEQVKGASVQFDQYPFDWAEHRGLMEFKPGVVAPSGEFNGESVASGAGYAGMAVPSSATANIANAWERVEAGRRGQGNIAY